MELHVDDRLLSVDATQAAASAALLHRLCLLAESEGARLSLRIRERFAFLDRGALLELSARGHEVGVHAHGRRLGAAVAALRRAGICPVVGAPGLVQASACRGWLLRESAAHGLRLLTDHGPSPAWAGEGRQARVEGGLTVMAPTVRPGDWGMVPGPGQAALLTHGHVDRLLQIERKAESMGATYFGLTLHEHDLCPPDSLRPSEAALEAFRRLLSPGALPSLQVCPVEGAARPPRARGDTALRLVCLLGRAAEPIHALVGRRPPLSSLLRPSPASIEVPVGARRIRASRIGPTSARAIVLVSHAGSEGGRSVGLRPFGLQHAALAEAGLALWLYDRAGTGDSAAAGPLAPGNPAHVEDWRAMLNLVRQEGLPVVALSWSSGIIPVLRAAAGGDRPDAMVDGEAPADRFSLVPPRLVPPRLVPPPLCPRAGQGGMTDLGQKSLFDDAAWEEIEPLRLLPALGCPYLRLQGLPDHIHGDWTGHASALIRVASASGLLLPGLCAARLPSDLVSVLVSLLSQLSAGGRSTRARPSVISSAYDAP